MQLPYINTRAHLSTMMGNYDAFAATYNDEIIAKREACPNTQHEYQTLKPTHRALFKDLVLEIGKKMLQNINTYQKIQQEQGETGIFKLLHHPLCGDGFYVCSTNRYQLSKHNSKDLSTIYRNILRLMEAGIITQKIGHGKKSNFELHINADFLLVSDKANPDYNPLQTSAEKTLSSSVECANCKEEKSVQEQLINKIYSADAVDKVNFGNTEIGENKPMAEITTDSEVNLSDGTLTRTEGKPNSVPPKSEKNKTEKPMGGAADVRKLIEKRGIELNKSPNIAQWHAFHRLCYAVYFIDYLIQTIYAKRGVSIFPEARIYAIEYAEKYYFPNPLRRDVDTNYKPCETLDQYATRLQGLKWCIDAANRYAARKGGFFVLINKYIDLSNENGLNRTVEWWKNSKNNEAEKAKHLQNIKDIKQLHEQIRKVLENQTYEELQRAEMYVGSHLPKYIHVFRRSLVTIINKFK